MERIITLLLALALGAVVLCWVLKLPPCSAPPSPPLIEDADYVGELNAGPMPVAPRVAPRPLAEFPSSGVNRPLEQAPPGLEEAAGRVIPRPLIERPNRALGLRLEGLPVSLEALPRPRSEFATRARAWSLEALPILPRVFARALIRYANRADTFLLTPPPAKALGPAEPRPVIERAGAGWSRALQLPERLLPPKE